MIVNKTIKKKNGLVVVALCHSEKLDKYIKVVWEHELLTKK